MQFTNHSNYLYKQRLRLICKFGNPYKKIWIFSRDELKQDLMRNVKNRQVVREYGQPVEI